jgi:hypothetical protein
MTSAVAVIGLVFDGHDLQRPDLNVFFEITEGLDDLPEVRGEDQLIPFRAGRLPGLRLPHRRPIVAVGHVMGPADETAKAAFRAYVDEIKGRLDPTAGERILVATLEDGSTRSITCAARNLIGGEGFLSEYRAFSIEWEAVADPMWHGAWGEWMLDSGLFLDDGWYLDELGYVVCTPTGSPFDVTFSALGTTGTGAVRVEVDGASGGVVGVSNVTLSPAVGFTFPALAGGALLNVDSGARTALLGTANARGNMTLLPGNGHGEYLRLVAGSNTIRVTGTPAQVRIYFDRSYL